VEQGQTSERNWRVRGWVLVPLGLFLVLFMGAILWNLMPTMLNPGVEVDGSTFSGTPEQAQLFFGIFALVIAFGALCIVNGSYMIATGRRNAVLTTVTLVIFAILFAIGWAIRKKWIV
jgi:MFS family permease